MAKNPKNKAITKKHLARLERERIQRRYILWASGVVFFLVAALIGYGILEKNVLQPNQPVAVVNEENISTDDFQAQTRYARSTMIRNAINTVQFMQLFGNDPSTASSFVQQLQQIQFQLTPEIIGEQVLNRLIEDALIRQEAERLGITVTDAEVEEAFQEAFGFYPDGTPTPTPTEEPAPTASLSPLQESLLATPEVTPAPTTDAVEDAAGDAVAETAQPAETEAVETEVEQAAPTGEVAEAEEAPAEETPQATATEVPTPTPYTEEGYRQLYNETVQTYRDEYGVSEADLRYVIVSSLYREKVMEAVTGDLPREEEQVWARHILVQEKEVAEEAIERLEAGENFFSLAAELSADSSNKYKGGDLGWFTKDSMVEPFAEAAFALEVGEISEPVETIHGWHVIQVIGHEDRPLTDDQYQQRQQTTFADWLAELQSESEVEIRDIWTERVPSQPDLPLEVQQIIQQASQPVDPSSAAPAELLQPEEVEPEEPAATGAPAE